MSVELSDKSRPPTHLVVFLMRLPDGDCLVGNASMRILGGPWEHDTIDSIRRLLKQSVCIGGSDPELVNILKLSDLVV